MLRRVTMLVTALALLAAPAMAEKSLTEKKDLKELAERSAKAADVTMTAAGVAWVIATDTTNTTSSASGAATEASYTAATVVSVSGGGTTMYTLTDAYDGYNALAVNGTHYTDNGAPSLDTSCASPHLVFNPQSFGNLSVQRKVFLAGAGPYVRWANIVTNNGATTATVTLATDTNLGSDSDTTLVTTSDGDGAVETTDSWFTTFEADGGPVDDPVLGHVMQATGFTEVDSVVFVDGNDEPEWSYTFDVAPGATAVVLFYGVAENLKAEANALAEQLANDPDLSCLAPSEIAALVNFVAQQPEPQPIPVDRPLAAGLLVLLLTISGFLVMRRVGS